MAERVRIFLRPESIIIFCDKCQKFGLRHLMHLHAEVDKDEEADSFDVRIDKTIHYKHGQQQKYC